MNILYLHQYFNTPAMSGGTRSYEIARRLVAMGHHVDLLTSDQTASDNRWRVTSESGIQVHWFSSKYSNKMDFSRRILAFIRFAVAATKHARKFDYDVVFATSTPLTIAIPGVLTARMAKVPLVFEVRDLWPAVPIAVGALRSPISKLAAYWLERFAYFNSARIIALAPGMKSDIVSGGIPDELVTVIPNGCDNNLFDPIRESKSVDPYEVYPGLKEKTVILYAGTMGIVNGITYIVRLAATLQKFKSDVRFVLIGDGRMKAESIQLAEDLDVLNKCLYFLDPMPKTSVAEWMRIADFSIITYEGPELCYRDSVANKFFDALAAGKPIVANYSGYATQIAVDNKCGFILPQNLEVAAQMLMEKIADQEWRIAARENGKRLATTVFNRDQQVLQLSTVLEAAVSDPISIKRVIKKGDI